MAAAQSAHTVRTRVVLAKDRPSSRPSTRAGTEPRFIRPDASGVVAGQIEDDGRLPTSPFTRPLDAEPYLEMEVSTQSRPVLEQPEQPDPVTTVEVAREKERLRTRLFRPANTVPRRLGRGTGSGMEHEEASDVAMAKLIESLADFTEAEPTPKELKWVGVVVSQPEIGACLLIGTWLRKDFRVTTPVEQMFQRDDGLFVQTATKSRYFVKHAGDVYQMR